MPQLPQEFYFTGSIEYDGGREYRNHSQMPLHFASEETQEKIRERWDSYWENYESGTAPKSHRYGIPADEYPTWQEVLDNPGYRSRLIEAHMGYERGTADYRNASRYLDLVASGERPGTSSKYAGLIASVQGAVESGRGIVGILPPRTEDTPGTGNDPYGYAYTEMMAENWADIFEDMTGYESSLYPA